MRTVDENKNSKPIVSPDVCFLVLFFFIKMSNGWAPQRICRQFGICSKRRPQNRPYQSCRTISHPRKIERLATLIFPVVPFFVKTEKIIKRKKKKLTGHVKSNLNSTGLVKPFCLKSPILTEFSPKTGVSTAPKVHGVRVSMTVW